MNLSLFGIGASLETTDGYCNIRELLPGGPAARGGVLKPGDCILAVAQTSKDPVDIVSMPLSHAVELIRGPKGSVVHVDVIPAGRPGGVGAEDRAPRARRDPARGSTGQGTHRRLAEGRRHDASLGVIDLPEFYADLGEEGEAGVAA